MTITPWTMYWLTRLDEIKDALGLLSFILLVSGIIGAGIATCAVFEGGKSKKLLYLWLMIPLAGVFGILEVCVPTEKDAAAILIIPKIVNNEKVAALPSKIVDLATDWLDALKPKK